MGEAINLIFLLVQGNNSSLKLGELIDETCFRQKNSCFHIIKHTRQAFFRMSWVQRDVDASRFYDPKKTNHHLKGVLKRKSNRQIRPHTKADEIMGKLIRLLIKLLIG